MSFIRFHYFFNRSRSSSCYLLSFGLVCGCGGGDGGGGGGFSQETAFLLIGSFCLSGLVVEIDLARVFTLLG